MMKCDTYSCEENLGAIVIVQAGNDPEQTIPESIRNKLGDMLPLRPLTLRENARIKKSRRQRFPENGTIIHIIKTNGYYIERHY
jgi:hypothetical protein